MMIGDFLPKKYVKRPEPQAVILKNLKDAHIKELTEMEKPSDPIREMGNALLIILGKQQTWDQAKIQIRDTEFINKL